MGTCQCTQRLSVVKSEQQQQQRRQTTVSVWKETQAVNNNVNSSEKKKLGYSLQKNNNASSSAYTNSCTRTIPLSRYELVSRKNNMANLFGYSVQNKITNLVPVMYICLVFGAEGRQHVGTATTPTTTQTTATAAAAADTDSKLPTTATT